MWYSLEIYPHHLLNGEARFPNQTNLTYLNKKNEYLKRKTNIKTRKTNIKTRKTNIKTRKTNDRAVDCSCSSLLSSLLLSTFLAPQKVSILCWDHLESLNWPHLVIWQGRIHNTTPHLQHRCINSYYVLISVFVG